MKTLLTIAVLAIALTSFVAPERPSAFCRGWEEGHCYGFRTVKGDFSVCPIPPLCPFYPLNCQQDDYRCGFAMGVLQGQWDAQNP
jgi:hypothetical protein